MAAIPDARFVHVNIVARDWRRLADFYVKVFGCEPVPPERDLSGDWVDRLTGLPGAHITGIHLRLPGTGRPGCTLELFQYHPVSPGPRPAVNRAGLAHLAFHVADVKAAVGAALDAGGLALGSIETRVIAGVGTLTAAYVLDPEGNIVEIQNWVLDRP